jgi:TolA-binding protein
LQGIGPPVTLRRFTATVGLLALLAAPQGVLPPLALGMQAGFAPGAEADTLTLSAEGGGLPKYSVRRTGAQELTVTFSGQPGEKLPPPPGVGGSKIISGVRPIPGGYKIQLKSSAFGYVNSANAGKLRIQVFPDAIGASWSDLHKDKPAKPDAKSGAKPDAKPAPKAEDARKQREEAAKERKAKAQEEAKAKAEAAKAKKEEAQREKEAQAKAKRDEKAAASQHAAPANAANAAPANAAPANAANAAPANAAPANAANAAKAAPPAEGTAGHPFYSVPYSMRAPVNKTVLGANATATLPPVEGHAAPPAAPKPEEKPAAPKGQTGGKLPAGVVEKPILQEHSAPAPASATPPLPAPATQAEHAPPAASLPAMPAGPVLDVSPAQGKPLVLFRAEKRGPSDLRPAEVLSGVPAAGKHAPATPQMAQGVPAVAKPLPNKPWVVRQPVQKVMVPTGGGASATLPQVGSGPDAEALHAAASEQHAAAAQPETAANATGHGEGGHAANATADHGAANASAPAGAHGDAAHPQANASAPAAAHGEDHAAPAKDAGGHGGGKESGGHGGKDKEQQGPLSVEQLKDQVLKAQSDMVGGKWADAVKSLEELLHEPNLKGEQREEVLYALADSYMQLYKDDSAKNFDKIMAAQQTAMNANLKSRHVPRALINMGLLNLRVNQLPEAKAYFNIVKKKYAHDQNASVIPYTLGEYYRGKGNLKAAAEQYQSLIQDYPDSRAAKETAFILAQTLRSLGNFPKAYQIVDYLDKRWPLFYMENPEFLRLEAEVEEKVGKAAQAKDHYWTYYNLKPAGEYADVTLVRIGDIYLRQDKKTAAKEIYQKALHDFPNSEGGLVARMRLAEEGIYDDPTMGEMAPVFDRPATLKPNETYDYIANKFPKSPLAPLALIKLGMWQFHHKAWLDAMKTADAFLSRYPASDLTGKAKELGFQSFLQSLPGLVQDGNYARVLQMYDTLPYVKENQGKLGDEAQMAMAVSAWKRGQPDRALKFAGRFLGKKPVPKYSEMALDLAMNIFMEGKQWKRISDLATKANAAWKLSPRQKAQFETARAMALENQGDTAKSLPLWTRIASDQSADAATRAHATYVLAKDAARKQDMVRLFALSQEALGQLLATGGDKDKIKDCLLMAITATERSGRFNETLKWGNEFDRIIPASDPDWAPVRLRLADIYRRGGQTAEWKGILEEIVKKKPGTLYARMAGQALESSALDQRLQNYLKNPQ